MLERVRVKGLHGKHDYDITFNKDLTLFTGQNGSGKTSLLKLVWSLLSHNRGLALRELEFEYASVQTDRFILEVTPKFRSDSAPYTARYLLTMLPRNDEIDAKEFLVLYDRDGYVRDGASQIEELNELLHEIENRTLFFPTFRRIEGGFGAVQSQCFITGRRIRRYRSEVAEALESFSDELSSPRHTFVTSISTVDVTDRLVDFKNRIVSQTNEKYLSFSKEVERIASNDKGGGDPMSLIRSKLSKLKDDCDELQKPWVKLSDISREIFKDGGVRVARCLTLGDENRAIDSANLSAGEKQMFSFLSYNAFLRNAIIFIDEPELSLHVDWQRILFDKLLDQESTNQFIATTHSPFIYTRYSDREFYLDKNRGWQEQDVANG